MKYGFKRALSALLVFVMSVSMLTVTSADAAAAPKLSVKSVSMVIGSTKQIKVKNAYTAKITYKSKNASVAAITNTGKVKAKKNGTAKIKVTVNKNGTKTNLNFTVNVKKPAISVKKAAVEAGSKLILSIKNQPKTGTISWSSNNKNVAKVSKKGIVTGISAGSATITATVTAYKKTYPLTCKVTVNETADKNDNSSSGGQPDVGGNSAADAETPAAAATIYTVTFNNNNGTTSTQNVESGKTVAKPKDPVKYGYKLQGWYTDPALKNAFDFSTVITSDLTLYARWEQTSTNGNYSSSGSGSHTGNSGGNGKPSPAANKYTVTFDSIGGSAVASVQVEKGKTVSAPKTPEKAGYVFEGWYTGADAEKPFDFNTPITADLTLYAKWTADTDKTTDADNDGVHDVIEHLFNTNIAKDDTDDDGLSDNIEIYQTGTDPTLADTDGNGIPDGDEDADGDGLTNLQELALKTDLTKKDSDSDDLSDAEEVNQYHTDPLRYDTDGDGVSDGMEVRMGQDPLQAESTFHVNRSSDDSGDETVSASVDIELSGEQVESLSIDAIENETLFPKEMQGLIGTPYDFNVDGGFTSATISFEFDSSALPEDAKPTIYHFNEETQELEPLNTTIINNNTASAVVEHFSTYLLIDRTVFEKSFKWEDTWATDGNEDQYQNVEVVFIIDDSGSMQSNDPTNERLTVARNLIDELPEDSKIGVVKFESNTSILTSEKVSDRETAKSYLTTNNFRSNGTTYMYTAIDDSFSLFDTPNDKTLRLMIVLSDGETFDTEKHSGTISNAKSNSIAVYTVGLGSSTSYFTDYLKPLAEETGGGFYLAANASELTAIYKDIGKQIDISTDSDGDGIPDYYEDHMLAFNGTQIRLDKNNPDTDGDHLMDGEEVSVELIYNADKSKVYVKGQMRSDPSLKDSDFDGKQDDADAVPMDNRFLGTLKTDYADSTVSGTMDYRWFFDDNTAYHPDLSKISLLFSSAIYHPNTLALRDIINTDTTNGETLDNVMDYFGFNAPVCKNLSDLYTDNHLSEVGLGYRTVEYNGTEKTILAVTVRGTDSSIEEWSSNFDIGNLSEYGSVEDWKTALNHEGFDVAANRILKIIDQYITDQGLDPSKLVYWVTGHSRGAGIANLIGAYLEDVGKTAFTYTFAAPNTTMAGNTAAYRSIFNIVNKDDFVPCLPMTGWGYGRYGRSASVSIASDYEKEWEALTGKWDYNPTGTLDKTVQTLTNVLNGDARVECYKYTCADHGDGSNDTITVKGFSDPAKDPKNMQGYYISEKNLLIYTVCQCPEYFLQLLAAKMGAEIGDLEFATWDVAKRYESAKRAIIRSAIGGIEHPHYTESYYVLAKNITEGAFRE